VADATGQLREALQDRYTLERELGRGGMATVYLAHDLRHDRPVALEVLHPELAATLGPERFLREIRLVARLQHPHILSALVVLGRLRAQRLTGRPYIRVAQYYAFLGEREAALSMLEQAAAERNPGLEMIKVEPFWNPVRQHPRFQEVLRQIGVSP
jgi:hypothetical protein